MDQSLLVVVIISGLQQFSTQLLSQKQSTACIDTQLTAGAVAAVTWTVSDQTESPPPLCHLNSPVLFGLVPIQFGAIEGSWVLLRLFTRITSHNVC